MKMLKLIILVVLAAFSVNSFAQSSASIKLSPIQLKETVTEPADNWLPLEIPKLHQKEFAFWKLTSEGFLCYSDGRFFYEDNYFQKMLDLSGIYGGWMLHSIMNGMFDFRYATFYPFRQNENIYPNIMPLRNYSHYDKVSSASTYIPTPVYFAISGLNNFTPQYVNAEDEINHKLKPVKLNESKQNTVTAIEVRNVNVYKYEKTKNDNAIERSIEWRKYNNNSNTTNNSKTYNTGSSTTGTPTTGTSTTTTGNNGSKGGNNGNNGNKTTESTNKKSE